MTLLHYIFRDAPDIHKFQQKLWLVKDLWISNTSLGTLEKISM